jgi:hypothetical protein
VRRGGSWLQTSPSRCRRRLGQPPRDRRRRRSPDQIDQPLERVLAIALLRSVPPGVEDEHALVGHAPAGEALQPLAYGVGQCRRAPHIESELHRRRKLVDVLAAGTGRANEALLDLSLVDGDAIAYLDHTRSSRRHGNLDFYPDRALLKEYRCRRRQPVADEM